MHEGEDPVMDVRIIRMKQMGPDGDRGWVVEVQRSRGWQVVLDDGTRGQAERVAAVARHEAGLSGTR